jgi:DNA-binding NtrC family response regulator
MSKNVLLIDDQELIFEVLRDTLEPIGCTVAWVSSGEEGLRHLKNTLCDIVFLDLNLGGGMDGVETLQHIHAANIRCRVYIITGLYDDYAHGLYELADREKVAFEILRKPLDLCRIRDIVADDASSLKGSNTAPSA